jgi:ribonuclease P protein component
MRRELRLRKRKEFEAVLQKGDVERHRLMVLRTLPNQLAHNRYGFITSRRLGGAVIRNRVRRRLREGIRSLDTRPGWDVVVATREAASRASFHELKSAVVDLFARAGILAEEPPQGEPS